MSINLNKTREELIELLEMTSRFASENDHKFFFYQPNPVMLPFHASTAKTRVLLGGNRSGKTTASAEEYAIQFTGKCPKSLDGIIPKHRLDPTRRIRVNVIDYPNAFEKIMWPKLQEHIPADSISDVIKEQGRIKAIVNNKGGFLEFMQYEQMVSKFQGTSRHLCGYDEEPPQSIRDENLMRLVDTDGEEIFSMTPISEESGSGYNPTLWIYDELFLKAGTQSELIEGYLNTKSNPVGDPNIHVFFASIYDNKAISKEAADRILSSFSKEEREARAFGKFMFLSGLIFKDYSDTIHLIPSFNDWYEEKTSNYYTLYLAIDPHPRVPHAVMFLVVRNDGFMCVVDELYSQFDNTKSFVDAVISKCNGKVPEAILIDPSAFNRDPRDGSCFAYDMGDCGLYPFPIEGSKDLQRGIILTKQTLMLDSQGKPGIYITDNCTRTRFELIHYRWDNWSKNAAPSKGVKQKPVDKDDHMMENLRRLITFSPRYITPYKIDIDEIEQFLNKSRRSYASTLRS